MFTLSCGMKISAVYSIVLSQSTCVTDGRTNRQTDRITIPKTALAQLLRAVKIDVWSLLLSHCISSIMTVIQLLRLQSQFAHCVVNRAAVPPSTRFGVWSFRTLPCRHLPCVSTRNTTHIILYRQPTTKHFCQRYGQLPPLSEVSSSVLLATVQFFTHKQYDYTSLCAHPGAQSVPWNWGHCRKVGAHFQIASGTYGPYSMCLFFFHFLMCILVLLICVP